MEATHQAKLEGAEELSGDADATGSGSQKQHPKEEEEDDNYRKCDQVKGEAVKKEPSLPLPVDPDFDTIVILPHYFFSGI